MQSTYILLAAFALWNASCVSHAQEPAKRILRAGVAATASYNYLLDVAERAGTPFKSLDPVWLPDLGLHEAENAAKATLLKETDVLTIVPLYRANKVIDELTKRGLASNPNILVTVHEMWEPRYPLETNKARIRPKGQFKEPTIEDLRASQAAYDKDVDEYCAGVNKQLGKKVIVTVPIGKALVTLKEEIIAGRVAAFPKQTKLYGVNGFDFPALALEAYCHYAVIFKKSPVGLPSPVDRSDGRTPLPDDLNRLLQKLAWDAVTHDPMSGVTAQNAP